VPASAATTAQARRALAREVRDTYAVRTRLPMRAAHAAPFQVSMGWLVAGRCRERQHDGWVGTARVRFYGRVADVSLHATRFGY
jgi:hypothetical protein